MTRKTLEERFWEKVDRRGPDECWPWLACKRRGYGDIMIWVDDKPKHAAAHRVAWMLTHGEFPSDGLHVCHMCNNPGCVNPSHLYVGTPKDNMNDRIKAGTLVFGEEHCLSVLTVEKVIEIRKRYAAGDILQKELGVEYNVSAGAISSAILGRTWKQVESHFPMERRGHKLIITQVLEIRKRFNAGGVLQRNLAEAYDVTQSAISAILNRRTWSDVSSDREESVVVIEKEEWMKKDTQSRLTTESVVEIRERYATGNVKQRELAAEYHMSVEAISEAIRGRTWKFAGGPIAQPKKKRNTKLTVAQVREIRRRFAAGDVRQCELAREFKVTDGAINDLLHQRTWADIE